MKWNGKAWLADPSQHHPSKLNQILVPQVTNHCRKREVPYASVRDFILRYLFPQESKKSQDWPGPHSQGFRSGCPEISIHSYKHKDFSVPKKKDESPLSFLSRLIVALPPRRESTAFTSINDLRKAAFLNKEPEGELPCSWHIDRACCSFPSLPFLIAQERG
jgi:hypothetical protein